MSNQARCDSKSIRIIFRLHDFRLNSKCNYQKQINFTPRQFQLEVTGFKGRLRKFVKLTDKKWNNFSKPGLKLDSTSFSKAGATKTKTHNELKFFKECIERKKY